MPRRPLKSGQLGPRPITFSPFGRSVSRAASGSSSEKKVSNSKFGRKTSSKFPADKTTNPYSRENDVPSDSSEDEPLELSSSEDEAPEVRSSEEETSTDVIEADFAFFDPKPGNFHGVKTLVRSYLDDKQWDISGFVDIIIAQTSRQLLDRWSDRE